MSRSSGQALPFVLIMFALVLAAVFSVGELGLAASLRAKAQAGADAAALAGAAAGEPAAQSEALANHVTLLKFEQVGSDVRVWVKASSISATAQARMDVSSNLANLAPVFRASLSRAQQIAGRPVAVTQSFDDHVVVSNSTANWLAPLSDVTGLCSKGVATFVICQRN